MAEESTTKKFKVNDRVRRVGGQGGLGIVQAIRAEMTTAIKEADKEKSLMINVLWDNGTLSYFSACSLEHVK